MSAHEWEPSPYGHGTLRCKHCLATEMELAVLGELNRCDARTKKEGKDQNVPPLIR